MIVFGAACLVLALVTALYAAGAALADEDRRWVDSSRRAVYALAALLTLAVVILEAAFLRSDSPSGSSPSIPRPPPRPGTS